MGRGKTPGSRLLPLPIVPPRALFLFFFSIIAIFIGKPSGSLRGGERRILGVAWQTLLTGVRLRLQRRLSKPVCSLRASSPIWASEASLARTRERGAEILSPAPRGFAAHSRVLARLFPLAQIGELASRLTYL